MKKNHILSFFLLLCVTVNAQYQVNTTVKGSKYFTNPVFAGDYPDPSIMRDGSDYYMVHSSFDNYPGLLIWHSRDLINWEPVSRALHKFVGSVWAPDLVKYKGMYYVYFPVNGTNYVVTAKSIEGPWSDPIDLKIGSIDPGHVVDADGKRYLYFSGGGYAPLSDDGLSILGNMKYTYSGWPIPKEWSIECNCQEGPKLIKHGDYYYITIAQGGTAGPATSHMAVSARSKTPFGPWENSPYNPIVHTNSSAEKWWSKGHATIIDDVNGNWWIVYHSYENGYYNMGRQTLLQPIEWTKDGWFRIPNDLKADEPMKRPIGEPVKTKFNLSDTFTDSKLHLQWAFYNECDPNRYSATPNGLVIAGKGTSFADCSPMLTTPSDHSYSVEVEMTIEGEATGGLLLFYNSNHNFAGVGSNSGNILSVRRGWDFVSEKNKCNNHVFLRLVNVNHNVDAYYSLDGLDWKKTECSYEVSSYNQNLLDGFLSLRIGLASVGKGKVIFKNFKYKTIESR